MRIIRVIRIHSHYWHYVSYIRGLALFYQKRITFWWPEQ